MADTSNRPREPGVSERDETVARPIPDARVSAHDSRFETSGMPSSQIDPKVADYALRLYEKGYTVAELAQQLAISQQRMKAALAEAEGARGL